MNNTETKAGINFSFPERARAPACQFMNRMGVEFFSQTFVKTPFLSDFLSVYLLVRLSQSLFLNCLSPVDSLSLLLQYTPGCNEV